MKPMQNRKQQGDVGVAHAIYVYTCQGYIVSIPNTDNSRYDLLVDKLDGKIYRVQCKTTMYRRSSGSYVVELRTKGGTGTTVEKCVRAEDVDLLWVTDGDGNGYEFPPERFDGKPGITLSGDCTDFMVG